MTAKQDLNHHVALVTGGSRGIGAAIALALADAGCAVAVNYRERAEDAEAIVARIRATGGRAIAVAADVSQSAAVTAMVERAATALGPIDILINNAGVAIVRGVDDLTEAEFDLTIAVNLKSAFLHAGGAAGDAGQLGPHRQHHLARRAAPARSAHTTMPRRPAWKD